jgi:transcriptional regulator with XRE-family HTH domain
MLELGKAIRIVREAKGMTLGALAERSGVSVPFASLVESGGRHPSLHVLRRVAEALGIPTEVLIMLSQPSGGNLRTSDRATDSLVRSIQKLFSVETELRSKLASEAKPRASSKRNG